MMRIQTLYLALAVLLLVLCCCMPLGTFEPTGMGLPSTMYSLVLLDADNTIQSYLPAGLLFLVVLSELTLLAALLGYKNRRKQMKTCSLAMFFELLWVFVYVILAMTLMPDTKFHWSFAACLPVAALILTWLARKGVKHDDDLVRSADRIR